MVPRTGVEPVIFSVKGKRLNHLSNAALKERRRWSSGRLLLRTALLRCIPPNSDATDRYTLSSHWQHHSPFNLSYDSWIRTKTNRIKICDANRYIKSQFKRAGKDSNLHLRFWRPTFYQLNYPHVRNFYNHLSCQQCLQTIRRVSASSSPVCPPCLSIPCT